MGYWLVKSEPEEWSWADQQSVEAEPWTGVRNHQAQKNMRAMQQGDLVLFYHSGKAREIVGLCTVSKTAYPDPTADKGNWCLVDISADQQLPQPVSLQTIKADPRFADLALVRQPRLSVMPIDAASFQAIMGLAGLK